MRTGNQASRQSLNSLRKLGSGGFTLIELLTVIGIMALLATITVGVIGVVGEKRKVSVAKAMIAQVETALSDYYAKYGQYPPENPVDSAPNPLYYELTGTSYAYNSGNPLLSTFTARDGFHGETAQDVKKLFGIDGFANAEQGTLGPNFINSLKPRQFGLFTNTMANVSGYVLSINAEAPPGRSIPAIDERGQPTTVNPIRYVVSTATNNPSSYDLWIELLIGDDTVVVGNWSN